MARFILFIVLFSILYYILHSLVKGIPSLRKETNKKGEPEELVQDPNCQTYIPKGSAVKKRIGGKDYYFCNPECLRKYLENS